MEIDTDSKASDDQWDLFAAQLEGERERERGGGEAIKRELALTPLRGVRGVRRAGTQGFSCQ